MDVARSVSAVSDGGFARLEPLEHDFVRHYPALRDVRSRAELHASALWAEIGGPLERLLAGVERGDRASTRPAEKRLRVAAWNIQRGARFEALVRALTDEPRLRDADALLLCEVDSGLARSGNRNVARDLAAALDLSYAFAPSYLTLGDDIGENPEGRENGLALAGQAILSRAPILRAWNVDVPELKDKFSSKSEKRLGKKRALLAEVATATGPLVLGACHLDSNSSPSQRARQLGAAIDCAEGIGARRVLLGGDFNCSTYDASSIGPLLRDLLHKLFVTGFRRTIDNYMTPERRYDTPLFERLAAHGFAIDGLNDLAHGTFHYDVNDPVALGKVRRKVGGLMARLLVRALRPWGGRVPARLDWFAGRGVSASSPTVVAWRDAAGQAASDHEAIAVDLAI